MGLTQLVTSDYLTTGSLIIDAAHESLSIRGQLSLSQLRVLGFLADHGGELYIKDLVQALGQTPGALTFQLDRLENKGAIVRMEDPSDRRTMRICLTAQGINEQIAAKATISEVVSKVTSPFGHYLIEVMHTAVTQVQSAHDGLGYRVGESASEPLLDASLICMAQVEQIVRRVGLSTKEFRMLFELFEHPHGVSCTNLARRLLLRLPNITGVSDSLVSNMLIKRSISVTDRRVTVLEITNTGYDVLRSLAPEVDRLFIDSLSTRTEAFYFALQKMSSMVVAHKAKSFRYD